MAEPLLDPDCRDGKCGSCVGGPCEHECHHRDPRTRPWSVWVGSERDDDGQPTTLHVAPSNGAHVAESDAEWLRELIRTHRGSSALPDDAGGLRAQHRRDMAAAYAERDEMWERKVAAIARAQRAEKLLDAALQDVERLQRQVRDERARADLAGAELRDRYGDLGASRIRRLVQDARQRAENAEAERDAFNARIRATCTAARIAREVGDHRKVVLLSDVERLLDGGQ